MVDGLDPLVVIINDEKVYLSDLFQATRVADEMSLFSDCIRRRVIRQLAHQEGLSVDQEKLQAGVDEWRYEKGIERAAETDQWLTLRGLTLLDVAEEVEYQMLEDALIQKVTKNQIKPYFAQHLLDFEEIEVCWIQVSNEGIAEEIRVQVTEEGADFNFLARCYSEDEDTKPMGGYLGRLRRKQLPKGIAPLVFAAEIDDVVGPIRVGRKHALYWVQDIFSADQTEAVEREIGNILFSRWFRQQLRQTSVSIPLLESLNDKRTASDIILSG